ncbi:MAG: hypothetical protein WC868_08465, partial [Bacteroidales bacterium]
MISISFNIGCRNCLKSDGIQRFYSLITEDKKKYQCKTEFEIMLIIEKWRAKDNKVCDFCGSTSVEVLDVKVDNFPLYDYDRIINRVIADYQFMLLINIDKRGSQIDLKLGGSQKFESNFLKAALLEIINTVWQRPGDNFIPQVKGNFFMAVSGSFDFLDDTNHAKIERYNNAGITQNEILQAIKPFAEQTGISFSPFENSDNNNFEGKTGKVFKGALFYSWFYIPSSEDAKNKGYTNANVCFDFDDNTIIAFGTTSDHTLKEFIELNKYNDFIIDIHIKPLIRQGKVVYFTKRC